MAYEFKLEITMENAAFDEGNSGRQVASILETVAREVEDLDLKDGFHKNLYDVNGNKVGVARTV